MGRGAFSRASCEVSCGREWEVKEQPYQPSRPLPAPPLPCTVPGLGPEASFPQLPAPAGSPGQEVLEPAVSIPDSAPCPLPGLSSSPSHRHPPIRALAPVPPAGPGASWAWGRQLGVRSGKRLQRPGPEAEPGAGAAVSAAPVTGSWPGRSSAGPEGGGAAGPIRAGPALSRSRVPTRHPEGPAHPHQEERLLVDEVLLLGCQLPRVHAGQQGLRLWLRRHHHGCRGHTSAKLARGPLPTAPAGPLVGPSFLQFLRRDLPPSLTWHGRDRTHRWHHGHGGRHHGWLVSGHLHHPWVN